MGEIFNTSIGVPLDQYYNENQNLIHHMLQKKGFYPSNPLYEDFFQIGAECFVKCYQKFKGTKTTKFNTYFMIAFKNDLQLKGPYHLSNIRIPRSYRDVWNLVDEHGNFDVEMIENKLKSYTSKAIHEAVEMYEHRHQFLNLDGKIAGKDGSESSIHEIVGFDDDYSLVESTLFDLKLTDKEKRIIKLALEGKNQSQIAEIFGVSQSIVSRWFGVLKKKYKNENWRN